MPARRTSPRRTATRPSVPYERTAAPYGADGDDGGSWFADAAPWLALLAVILSAAALGWSLVGRGSGGDLADCRKAAWASVPDAKSLPANWTLGSNDLNANGMTISVLGPPSEDGT